MSVTQESGNVLEPTGVWSIFHLRAYQALGALDVLAFRSVFWTARSEFHVKRTNPQAEVTWPSVPNVFVHLRWQVCVGRKQ